MRPRIRRIGMTSRALLYAIVVHVIAAVLLVLNLDWPAHIFSARRAEPAPVQASVVTEKEIQAQEEAIRQKDEAKKQQELEAKKKLDELLSKQKEEQQRLADIKKRQEEEQKKAEEYKKKKEQEKQQLAKLQQQQQQEQAERKKAQAEAKKKQQQEAEKKRKVAEAQRQKALAAKREREKELKAQLAKEQLQKRVDAALAQYIPIIRQKVSKNWNLPEGVQDNIEVHVNVQLSPDGDVISAQIVKSSGNPVFDRSVENAVLKASPLPIPQDQGVNEEFRNLDLTFRPEQLVS